MEGSPNARFIFHVEVGSVGFVVELVVIVSNGCGHADLHIRRSETTSLTIRQSAWGRQAFAAVGPDLASAISAAHCGTSFAQPTRSALLLEIQP